MTMTPPLTEVPGNPAPPGAAPVWIDGYDGGPLRTATWNPAGDARGTVVLLGGRTEFIEKYFEVIGELLSRGFAVATMEWRGQGLSVRTTGNALKGHIADFAEFDTDLAIFLRHLGELEMPRPFIGLAHSMGGHSLVRWLHLADTGAEMAERCPKLAAAAVTAPMLALRLPPAAELVMRAAAFTGVALGLGDRYIPGGGDSKSTANDEFDGNVVTSDPVRFRRALDILKEEPALALASPTLAWGAAAVESIERLQAPGVPETITTPLLVCGAGRDMLIDTGYLPDFTARVPNGRYEAFSDAKHEILMEADSIRAHFWRVFDGFVDETL